MRRFTALTLVFCSLAIAAWAESPLGNVEDLIQDGLFKNSGEIRRLSATLTDPDRHYLIEEYGKRAQVPGLLNLALGLGIGSFVQGDRTGGLLGVAGDILGLSLFAGFYISYENTLRHNLSGQGLRDPGYLALAFAASSLVVITGNRAIQLGRAISYTNRYNETLKDSIGLR